MDMKKQISQLSFIVSFIVIVFFNFLEQTMFVEMYDFIKPVGNLSIKIACALLLVKYILDIFPISRAKIKGELVPLTVFMLGLLVSRQSTGTYVIIPIILLLMTVRSVEEDKIFKIWLVEIATLMLITILSYMFGILGEPQVWLREDGTMRHSLGFAYSTFSANYMLYITIFYLYFRKNRITYAEIIGLLSSNVLMYVLTNTKAAFAYSLLSVVIAVITKRYHLRKPVEVVNKYIMLFSALCAVALSYMFRYRFWILEELNRLLTGRLYLGSKAFDNFPLTLFGAKIKWNKEQQELYNFLDSSYLNILFSYGLVILVLIVLGYYLLSKTKGSHTIYYTAMILCISLHTMFDPQLIAIMYNPSLLLLGYLFAQKNIFKRDKIQKINL